MGYLDNSSITVDTILTKKGRELLARNDGSFNISHFALADDEIDYNLFNLNHPNGSQYSGEAIENMSLLEAIPDENHVMKYKLMSLTGATLIPTIIVDEIGDLEGYKIQKSTNKQATLTPQTKNKNGNSTETSSESYYIFRIADARLVSSFTGVGGTNFTSATEVGASSLNPFSITVRGNSLTMTTVGALSGIFGSNSGLITTITIIGGDTGASMTVPLNVTKTEGDSGASSVPSNT